MCSPHPRAHRHQVVHSWSELTWEASADCPFSLLEAQWLSALAGNIVLLSPTKLSYRDGAGNPEHGLCGMELNDQSSLELYFLVNHTSNSLGMPGKVASDTTTALPGTIWPHLLQTLESTMPAHNYHFDTLDLQVGLLNLLAVFTAGIYSKLDNLNKLILRAQSTTDIVESACCCSPIIDSLSLLSTFLNDVLSEIKRLQVSSGPHQQIASATPLQAPAAHNIQFPDTHISSIDSSPEFAASRPKNSQLATAYITTARACEGLDDSQMDAHIEPTSLSAEQAGASSLPSTAATFITAIQPSPGNAALDGTQQPCPQSKREKK
ncbi:hypothetical protein NDU88_006657 [Pleurodeles waltl]|uniref:Uncharacterized protein n=1 Tax=Pleurodeles waltl TaxID=8319 RepID=A0AAV7VRL6_PLEWA|nr:hypothetical protein NDU88_006657 [Pleurodeles waltl]